MKTYLTLLIALVIGTSAKASINHSATAPFGHGDSVIFTENGHYLFCISKWRI